MKNSNEDKKALKANVIILIVSILFFTIFIFGIHFYAQHTSIAAGAAKFEKTITRVK